MMPFFQMTALFSGSAGEGVGCTIRYSSDQAVVTDPASLACNASGKRSEVGDFALASLERVRGISSPVQAITEIGKVWVR